MTEGEIILALLGIMVALLSPLYMEVFKIAKQVTMLVVIHGKSNSNANCGGTGAGRLEPTPSLIGSMATLPPQTGEKRS